MRKQNLSNIGCFIFIMVLFPVSVALGKSLHEFNYLQGVHAAEGEDRLDIHLEFKKHLREVPHPVFYPKSVQMDFPNAYIHPAKQIYDTGDPLIPRIHVSQFDPDTLRVRFMIGEDHPDLSGRFEVRARGQVLEIAVEKNTSEALDRLLARVIEARTEVETPAPVEEDEPATFALGLATTLPYPGRNSRPREEKNSVSEIVNKLGDRRDLQTEPIPPPEEKKPAAKPAGEGRKNTESGKGFLKYKEPRAVEPPSLMASGLKMIYTLGLVLGLMFFLFYIFKNTVWKNSLLGGGDKLIQVLGTGFLGPRKSVVLVKVAGEILVLGIAGEAITYLSKIEDEEQIARVKNAHPEKFGERSPSAPRLPADCPGQEESVFAKYIKQFSGPGQKQNVSVDEVTAMIRKNLGKLKKAS